MLVFNEDSEELYVLGVFKGQFLAPHPWCLGTLYQATAFSPSLRYMEEFLYRRDLTGKLRLVCRGDPIAQQQNNSFSVDAADILPSLYKYPD